MGMALKIQDLYNRRNFSVAEIARATKLDGDTVRSCFRKDDISLKNLTIMLDSLGYYPQFRIKPRGILCDLHLEKEDLSFPEEFELTRKRLLYKQADVAKKLGVTRQAIEKRLKNKNFKESDMIRYADAIDCDVICNFVRKPRD